MPFMGIGKKPPAPKRRRKSSSPWLRSVMKEESSRQLIKDMQAGNPVVQAAIVQKMTGIPVEPASIKIITPQERFEAAVTNAMLNDLDSDEEFMAEAKARMLEKVSYGDGRGRGRYGYTPYGRRGAEDEEFGPYGAYPPGYDPNDPETMVDRVERLKDRLGGKSGLDSIMNSELLSTVVKTLLPLLLSKGGAAQTQQVAGPQMISVEMEGRLVEMSREAYEIYKRQRARMLAAGDSHGAVPMSPAPANGGTTRPATPAGGTPAASAAAPVAEKGKAEEPKPSPGPADEAPIMIDNEELRENVLTLVKQLIDDTEKKTPLQFAQYLVGQANANDMNAIVAVNFLNTITYEQGIGYLERLKHYEDFLPYIRKIEAKEQYMRAFLEHVKELAEEK